MDIVIVPFGSPLYERTKAFRAAILRTPLGLQWSEQDLAGEESQIHIAAVDPAESVVGTVLLKPQSKATAKLRQMAVSERFRGSGLGRKLVLFAEQVARDRGLAAVELHARVSAVSFYAKLGYATEGDVFTEVTVPTVRMTKTLTPNSARQEHLTD